MTSSKLLLVDDDQELCHLLKEYLQTEGFEVSLAHDGAEGLRLSRQTEFDVIVLDVMMPSMSGLEALRQIREEKSTPILMLTAKGDTVDRIIGLEMGADDYMPKPGNPRELVARLRAILRRTEEQELTAASSSEDLSIDDILLQPKSRAVYYRRQAVALTGAEFTVLELLMLEAGEVISKETLTEKALNRKLTPYDRSIDVHVSNIRKKFSALGASKDFIINIRGAGYMLTRR